MRRAATPKIVSVRLTDLTVHPLAIREVIQPHELGAMGNAIREFGIIGQVLVRACGCKYQVLSGWRYFMAAEFVGLKCINVAVCVATDAQAVELVGLERVVQARLDPLSRAQYIVGLMRPVNAGGGGLSAQQVAERFGKPVKWVRRMRELARLPEPWRGRLVDGKLSESFVLALLPYVSKPVVMLCIARHQYVYPERWQRQEDWFQLAKAINRKYEELNQSEQWSANERVPCIEREIKASLSPDWHAEERMQRQVDQLEEEFKKEDQLTSQHACCGRLLSREAAEGLLMPFEDSLADLQTLQEALTACIEELTP